MNQSNSIRPLDELALIAQDITIRNRCIYGDRLCITEIDNKKAHHVLSDGLQAFYSKTQSIDSCLANSNDKTPSLGVDL